MSQAENLPYAFTDSGATEEVKVLMYDIFSGNIKKKGGIQFHSEVSA